MWKRHTYRVRQLLFFINNSFMWLCFTVFKTILDNKLKKKKRLSALGGSSLKGATEVMVRSWDMHIHRMELFLWLMPSPHLQSDRVWASSHLSHLLETGRLLSSEGSKTINIFLLRHYVMVVYSHHLCQQRKAGWQQSVSGSWPQNQTSLSLGNFFC